MTDLEELAERLREQGDQPIELFDLPPEPAQLLLLDLPEPT